MSFFSNTLFATASIALTAGIVAASAAPAAASVPTETAPQTVVRYADLNLADQGGRADLDARIRAAADTVCPSESATDVAVMQCRRKAITQAHRDIAERLDTRSPAPVRTAAP